MRRAVKLHLLLLPILTSGCAHRHPAQLIPAEYIRYVEAPSNQLKGTVSSGAWSYEFQYKPAAYIVLRESDGNDLDKPAIEKRVVGFDSTIWFNISISVQSKTIDPLKYGVRDLNEYNQRLSYFLGAASQKFRLVYGDKGEMRQVGYYFENNYGIKPEAIAVVGFHIPEARAEQSFTIEYNDELFNAGILKFNVSRDALKNIPLLSIEAKRNTLIKSSL